MQRLVTIPTEQYGQMVERYKKVVNELVEIRNSLIDGETGDRQQINRMLDKLDAAGLQRIYFLLVSMMKESK